MPWTQRQKCFCRSKGNQCRWLCWILTSPAAFFCYDLWLFLDILVDCRLSYMDSSTITLRACPKALVICPLRLLITSGSLRLADNVLFPSHCTIRKSIQDSTRGSEWIKECKDPICPWAPIWLALNNINTVLSLILCMILCGSGSAYVAIFFLFGFQCIQSDNNVHVVSVNRLLWAHNPQ